MTLAESAMMALLTRAWIAEMLDLGVIPRVLADDLFCMPLDRDMRKEQ